jgi:hypothetical protein
MIVNGNGKVVILSGAKDLLFSGYRKMRTSE